MIHDPDAEKCPYLKNRINIPPFPKGNEDNLKYYFGYNSIMYDRLLSEYNTQNQVGIFDFRNIYIC